MHTRSAGQHRSSRGNNWSAVLRSNLKCCLNCAEAELKYGHVGLSLSIMLLMESLQCMHASLQLCTVPCVQHCLLQLAGMNMSINRQP